MKSLPVLRRWVSALITVGVFALVLGIFFRPAQTVDITSPAHATPTASVQHDWAMFGGTLQRNMVTPSKRMCPPNGTSSQRRTSSGSEPGLARVRRTCSLPAARFLSALTTKRPAIPRSRATKASSCASASRTASSSGKRFTTSLLRVWSTTAREGICSTAFVDGNRLYYVSNQCDLVCADTEGFLDGQERRRAGRKVQGASRRRLRLASGHDEGPGRLPAQPGDQFASRGRQHCLPGHEQRRGRGAHQCAVAPRRPASSPLTRRQARSFGKTICRASKSLLARRCRRRGVVLAPFDQSRRKDHPWTMVDASYGIVNGKPQVVFPVGTAGFTPSSPTPAS